MFGILLPFARVGVPVVPVDTDELQGQVMAEFGLDTIVLLVDSTGELVAEHILSDLLPEAFSDADLKQS